MFIKALDNEQGFFNISEINQILGFIKEDCSYSRLIDKFDLNITGLGFSTGKTSPAKSNILVIGGVHGILTAAAQVISFISQICLSLLSNQFYMPLLKLMI